MSGDTSSASASAENPQTKKIAFQIDESFYNEKYHAYKQLGYEIEGEIYTYRYLEDYNKRTIASQSIRVRDLDWKILGEIKEEHAFHIEEYNDDHCVDYKVTTLRLSLACSDIPDDFECAVFGRFTVGTKRKGRKLKSFSFCRTFSPQKLDFLDEFDKEIDIFEDLKLTSVNDRVVVQVEFMVQPLRKIRKCIREDTITVWSMGIGQEVKVNKHLLALHSEYFSTRNDIILPEQTTVDDFLLLLDILDGKHALDDETIESGVYCLAAVFGLEELEEKCHQFLIEESRKSAFFKYRLADTYGMVYLRDFILMTMTKKDFRKDKFLTNTDYKELSENGKAAILARKAEIDAEKEEPLEPESEISDENDEEMESEHDEEMEESDEGMESDSSAVDDDEN